MRNQFKNFRDRFISGAIGWVLAMIFIASIANWQIDWFKWTLITVALIAVPNAIMALAFSGETFEQREQREMDELDQRISDRLKAKGVNK